MNEEKALRIIRRHRLKAKEGVLWWDKKKKDAVHEVIGALDALSKHPKLTSHMMNYYDYLRKLLPLLLHHYEDHLSAEDINRIMNQDGRFSKVAVEQITDDTINHYLDKIVDELGFNMIELALNVRNAPEREAFCVPGCGLCCCLTRGSGVAVFDNEIRQVQDGITRFNAEFGERLVLDTEDIPTKRKNYEWVGRFKFGKFMVAALPASTTTPSHIKELSEHGFRYKGQLGYTCHLLAGRRSERLSFERWKALVQSYAAALRENGKTLNITEADFPGEFQGMMCGIHQYRPHECRSNGCNYARKIVPKIIREYGAEPLEKMFREPTLIGRYKTANTYFKG